MKRIFVIDDERDIRQLIVKYLVKEGFDVTDFSGGQRVLEEFTRLKPDLLVMDIMMPGIDGLELCREIRKLSEVPIIFVSARGEEIDRIIGLEIGADDYLSKPFSPRELVVRIKNIFRRMDRSGSELKQSSISVMDCTLHKDQRRVTIGDQNVDLTTREFDTLCLLLTNVNLPLTREQLLEQVWGYDYFGEARIVDDVIKRLRKKLKAMNAEMSIATVWGFGYKVEDQTKQ